MTSIQVIQSLDVYFFSLFLLAIIAFKTLNNPNGKTPQSRTFSVLVILNFLIIIADCTTLMLDGHPGLVNRIILLVSATFGFSFQVTICVLWFWYARAIVFPDRKFGRRWTCVMAFPALVCVCISILSGWTGWFYRYDESNCYHRGRLFMLVAGVSYLYVACGYYMIIRYRHNLERRHLMALASFALPPLIGGIMQNVLYGVTLIWPCTTFSLLIIYLAIQNELLLLDHLTGLNNRLSFDYALRRRIANAKFSGFFALMLIDLDNFKSINDRFGHVDGDAALKEFSRLLEAFFRKNGFVARFGGDEFAVIVDLVHLDELHPMRDRLQDEVDGWNNTSGKPWKLAISLGYAPYIPEDRLSQDNFLVQVDKLLTLDKIVPQERRFRNRYRR